MKFPSRTSSFSLSLLLVLALPSVLLAEEAAKKQGLFKGLGKALFATPASPQALPANDEIPRARTHRTAESRRARRPSSNQWLPGVRTMQTRSNSSTPRTYPITERRGNVTTVAVNPRQEPAVIKHSILSQSNRSNSEIVIDLSSQRAFLLVNGLVAVNSPISTARTGKYTPTGTYRVTERVRTGKISTFYNVHMPNWMRLNSTVFGVHGGYVPGYPASAGCVRLPFTVAPYFYNYTKSGTKVSIRV